MAQNLRLVSAFFAHELQPVRRVEIDRRLEHPGDAIGRISHDVMRVSRPPAVYSEKAGTNLQWTRLMMPATSAEVTLLLKAWRDGDSRALERLTPLVYAHLRQLGRQHVRGERAEMRGDATSLVHQAFIKLVDARAVDWQDRSHFLAVCAQIMRRILVDAARARATTKRGAGMHRIELSTSMNLDRLPAPGSGRAAEICALDEALNTMARKQPRRARVVELRFFGGLTVEETAAALEVSPQTVMRDWKLARAWLALELSGKGSASTVD